MLITIDTEATGRFAHCTFHPMNVSPKRWTIRPIGDSPLGRFAHGRFAPSTIRPHQDGFASGTIHPITFCIVYCNGKPAHLSICINPYLINGSSPMYFYMGTVKKTTTKRERRQSKRRHAETTTNQEGTTIFLQLQIAKGTTSQNGDTQKLQ